MANERILIVEDNKELGAETRGILTNAGYKVETVATAQAALDAVRAGRFDLLLVDVYLPDINGIEAFQQIRALQPNIAGVAITAYSSWDVSMEVVRAGFGGYLVKPIPPEQLVATVIAALEQQHLRDDSAQLRGLIPLYEASRHFMNGQELDPLLQEIAATARRETHADSALLVLLYPDNQEVSNSASDGLSQLGVETYRQTLGKQTARAITKHGEALWLGAGAALEPEMQKLLAQLEVGSVMALPVRIGANGTSRGETLGVLNLMRARSNKPFTRDDLARADILASQAALAIDKARLIQVLQTVSDTSQHLAGALDLDEAATILLDATMRIAGARGAVLWLVEEVSNQLTLYKTAGLTAEEQRELTPPPFVAPPDPSSARELRREGALALPIMRVDKKFGLIEVRMPPGTRVPPDRLGILRTLAQTAAAVIESHRLRARELIAFREIDNTLRAESNLQQVLERLVLQMAEACGAQGGAIFLRSAGDDTLDTWAQIGHGAPPEIAREIIQSNQLVIRTNPGDSLKNGFTSVLAAPLTIGTRVEGAVVLTHREPRAFAPRHLNLLSVLSSSAALIVRNAQLYAWSEEKVITEERARMAREMHDGLAQDLSFLLLRIQSLQQQMRKGKSVELDKELVALSDTLRRDVGEVRRTIFALRPLDIEKLGFVPALEKFTSDFAASNDVEMHLNINGDAAHLSPKLQSALFRLVQESLNNVRKHANAKKVWVDLNVDAQWANLKVRDDGIGFEPEETLALARKRGSVGMLHMRERAERAGGNFELKSAPGKGTKIEVKLPIK